MLAQSKSGLTNALWKLINAQTDKSLKILLNKLSKLFLIS